MRPLISRRQVRRRLNSGAPASSSYRLSSGKQEPSLSEDTWHRASLFVDRKARRGQTCSALAAKLADWLQSPEAKEWREAREKNSGRLSEKTCVVHGDLLVTSFLVGEMFS
ncbi:unnamed protein product [Durusdinium trenchii]|uniref:Uncharacterized protein n=1 Tax=Durusdinium trenchii TaxID=1381693 RepID=A0ABP0S6L6_9DINO